MSVFIFTEGTKKTGYGHIARTLSVHQALKEEGISSSFIVKGDKIASAFLKGENHRLMDWIKSPDKAIKLIKLNDLAVVDSYLAPSILYRRIYRSTKLCVSFDDNLRMDYPGGVVVNGTIFAQDFAYRRRNGVRYLLGISYMPLRRELWKESPKTVKKNVDNILITFGGSDLRGLTPRILRYFVNNHVSISKNVIIGKGFSDTDIKLIKKIKDRKTKLFYHLSALKMKQLMLKVDIAVSAGGQTLYELARIGVPTIAIIAADNQLANVRGWQKQGFIEIAGYGLEKDIVHNVSRIFNKLLDRKVRLRMSLRGRSVIDGQGSRRIAQEIRRGLKCS